MSDERDRPLDHDYDGIREYDNPLPGWWVGLFWITCVFSAWYFLYYHFGHGESVHQEYDRQMLALLDVQSQQLLKLGPITDDTIVELRGDETMMAAAGSTFAGKCASCHGPRGEGTIGPNLTDEYWLHGGSPTQVFHTITEGVPAKGMIAWKTQLGAGEILAMTAYVGTLAGTNPPNAKAPQGDRLVPPGPGPAAAATPSASAARPAAGG